MNDEGQDYMKGYGDGYSRACEDILKAIVEKKKKQENSRKAEWKKDLECFWTCQR